MIVTKVIRVSIDASSQFVLFCFCVLCVFFLTFVFFFFFRKTKMLQHSAADESESLLLNERFPVKQKCHDLPFLVVYMALFAFLVGVVVYASLLPAAPPSDNTTDWFLWLESFTPAQQAYFLAFCGIIAAAATGWSILALVLLRFAPVAMIWCGIVFSFVCCVASCVQAFLSGYVAIGVLLAVFALLNLVYIVTVYRRVPLSASFLRAVGSLLEKRPSLYGTSFVALLIQSAWLACWMSALLLCQRISWFRGWISLPILLLTFFWTQQIVQGSVHVLVASVSAHWYFFPDESNHHKSPHFLALFFSFGSVCFGSLIVAILRTLRALCHLLMSSSSSTASQILSCIARAILSLLDSLAQWFNSYAFAEIVLYRLSYVASAKRVWRLLMDRGWTAMVNDSLVAGAVFFASLSGGAVGAICAYFLYGVLHFAPFAESTVFFCSIGFSVAMSVCLVLLETVEAAVTSLFVCIAEEPEQLRHVRPELYAKLRESYPHLLNPV